jgi:thiamine-phosphate pyrophosphorylase
VLRYAITQRTLFSGDDPLQRAALVRQAARWAADGIDFIQLREKDLPTSDLATLARNILEAIRDTPTKLLINSRPDVALATGAHGVHLAAHPGQLTPTQVRHLYAKAGALEPLITLSCHTLADIAQVRKEHPSAILFAPVFEKSVAGQQVLPGTGLDRLHEACQAAAPIPVYALGGITWENAPQCLAVGAAGVAGIRLFHNAPSNEPQ